MTRTIVAVFDGFEGFDPMPGDQLKSLAAQSDEIVHLRTGKDFAGFAKSKVANPNDTLVLCSNRFRYPEIYLVLLNEQFALCGYDAAGLDGYVFPDLFDGLEDTVCTLTSAEGGLEVNALDLGGMAISAKNFPVFSRVPDDFATNGWRYAAWLLSEQLEQMGCHRYLLRYDDVRTRVKGEPPVPRRVSPPEMVRRIHAFGGLRRLMLPPVAV
jgi:hypothetical protein